MGADVSEPQALPEHGVTTVFINLGNTKLELLHPLGDKSPIQVIIGITYFLFFNLNQMSALKRCSPHLLVLHPYWTPC